MKKRAKELMVTNNPAGRILLWVVAHKKFDQSLCGRGLHSKNPAISISTQRSLDFIIIIIIIIVNLKY